MSFPESPERVLFVSRKAYKRRFNVTFSLVRKSNPKVPQRSADLWTPESGSKFRAVNFLIRPQALCYQEIFMENRRFVPYSSEYFEPVRKGYFTAQGFAGIYKKADFDLGGQ